MEYWVVPDPQYSITPILHHSVLSPRRRSVGFPSPRGASACRPGPRRARAAPPQLPALLHRPGHLAHRDLDPAARPQLVDLPPHPLRLPAGPGRLLGADRRLRRLAVFRRAGGPLEAAYDAARHPEPGDGAGGAA